MWAMPSGTLTIAFCVEVSVTAASAIIGAVGSNDFLHVHTHCQCTGPVALDLPTGSWVVSDLDGNKLIGRQYLDPLIEDLKVLVLVVRIRIRVVWIHPETALERVEPVL